MSTYDDVSRRRGNQHNTPRQATPGQQMAGQGHSEYSGSGGNAGRDMGGSHHDPHYAQWRRQHADELDRDYDDWRRERQQQFADDFSAWRNQRAGTTERASTEDTDVDSGLSADEVSGDAPNAASTSTGHGGATPKR